MFESTGLVPHNLTSENPSICVANIPVFAWSDHQKDSPRWALELTPLPEGSKAELLGGSGEVPTHQSKVYPLFEIYPVHPSDSLTWSFK